MRLLREVEIAASPDVVFQFHERPDAFALLQPPWEPSEVVVPPSSLAVGTRVTLKTRVGPIPVIVESEHVMYEPEARRFADRMVRGPFREWLHEHRVEAAPGGARLVDDITYELPFGRLGALVAGRSVQRRLERMFDYRHAVTRMICEGASPEEARARLTPRT